MIERSRAIVLTVWIPELHTEDYKHLYAMVYYSYDADDGPICQRTHQGVELVGELGLHCRLVDLDGSFSDLLPRVDLTELAMEGRRVNVLNFLDGFGQPAVYRLQVRLSELDHVPGQHLWNSTDVGGDDEQAGTRRLQIRHAEGLGKRRIEENVTALQGRPNFVWRQHA